MTDKSSTKKVQATTPGTIVLQWLTYAFWGSTIVAIAYLAAVITNYIIGVSWDSDSIEPIAYGIAATLILLPFSVVCDWLYSKREKQDKKGFSAVIMVIYAILFALATIGALISAVFSAVGLLLSTGDTSGSITAIVVSSILVVLYAKLTVRVVRPLLFKKFRLLFRISMSLIVVVALAWGVIGPVSQAVTTKDDRALRDALINMSYAINQYVSTNYTLPETTQEVTTDSALLKSFYPAVSSETLVSLIDKGTITYKPNTKPPVDDPSNMPIDSKASSKKYFYELCGVFTHDLKQRYWNVTPYAVTDSEGYGMGVAEGPITAGTNCYKLTASYYKED